MDDRIRHEIDKVILREGGLVDHPADDGKITKYGISQRSYPDLDIRNLTKEDAADIYFRDFYQRPRLDLISDHPVWSQVFDFGINAGMSRAVKLLQILVDSPADGGLGPNTAKALFSYNGNLCLEYYEGRVAYYERLVERRPKLKVFIRGWKNRAEECFEDS